MFKWLANLIVRTPIQGTCSCCEGKKEQLRQMQKALLSEEEPDFLSENETSCGGECSCFASQTNPYEGLNLSSSMQGRFEFNPESGTFKRSVRYSNDKTNQGGD